LHGTGLIEEHVVVFAGPLLASRTRHLSLRLLVELVADADEGERVGVLGAGVLVETSPPAAQRIERGSVCNVVDEGAAICSSVERVTQRLELLLSGSIPDLQRHHRVVY